MNVLIILNDPPYATEPVYNGSRLALALLNKSRRRRSRFLMASSVIAAKAGQTTPDGHCNIARTLKRILASPRQGASLRHMHRCARPRRLRPDGRRLPQQFLAGVRIFRNAHRIGPLLKAERGELDGLIQMPLRRW